MKLLDKIINFFNKLFGREKRYLLQEPKQVNNAVERNNSNFMASIKITDEKQERKELNVLLEQLNEKSNSGNLTKDDLINLQDKIDKNFEALLKSNQKQHEDIKRYGYELDAYKKRINSEGVE